MTSITKTTATIRKEIIERFGKEVTEALDKESEAGIIEGKKSGAENLQFTIIVCEITRSAAGEFHDNREIDAFYSLNDFGEYDLDGYMVGGEQS